ncbi:MAG TPA: ribose ABC transporter permease [Bacteroidetes bacterium]|nr:ribose ABC transporter permease [Bacteroidota bacterium]
MEPIKSSLLKKAEFGILGALLAEILLLTFLTASFGEEGFSSKFLNYSNVVQVLRSTSFIAMIVVGQTVVLIAGGIDLAVGSVLGLAGVVTAILIGEGSGSTAGILAGVVVGVLSGALTGFVITRFRVSPFITTLGMLSVARGLAYGITGGETIRNMPEEFLFIGQGSLFGVPIPVLVTLLFAVMISYFLRATTWGRYAYAIGGNETAAMYSGVNVKKMKLVYYSICGVASALAGVFYAARFGVGQSTAGLGYELDVIAAAVIGGVSLSGGKGTILGAIIGSVFMGILRNGLVLLDVSAYWQQVAIGGVIVLAVGIDMQRKNS